ncbi:glycosyltransferase family 4 protein [Fontivita pretiosa]|uniref:glycosyltransferase family 4 protein n=1 Tax=Fontivita pretiosa TaxID=2989684 RepID=UPI003D1830F7
MNRITDGPMNLALIHQPWSVIEPPVNGADSVALLTDEIARRLAARGHRTITYSRLGRGQKRLSHFQAVEYRRASVSIDRWIKLIMQELDRRGWRDPTRPFFSSAWCYRQFIGQVLRDLSRQARQQPLDVVHIHNFSQFVPLIRRVLPDACIVLQMHCEWLNQLDATMIQQRLEQADLVLGVSDFLAEKIRRRFPSLAHRCRHVYNGVAIERFATANTDRPRNQSSGRILYVGRLSPEKGIHVLLDAFAIVVRHHRDCHLELIGPESVVPYEMIIPFSDDPLLLSLAEYYRPGAYGQLLRQKLAALPDGSVTFRNQGMDHTDLVQRYHAADVFVAPSIWQEPFGMPLVEAMAAGLPVIATRRGAFPEIVQDEQTGLLVPPADAQALAEAILRLLDDPPRRRQLGRAGFQRAAANFTWDHVADALIQHYRNIRQARGRSSAGLSHDSAVGRTSLTPADQNA